MRKPEVFTSRRDIPIVVPDLAPVAQDVMDHFRDKGFETIGGALASGAWEISIRKGKWVKATLGTKLALNILIRPEPAITHVQAGAGVFGASVAPALVSWYVTWPTALTRVVGLIRQAHLDDQAIAVVESSLRRHEKTSPSGAAQPHADHPATAAAGARRPASDRGRTSRCTSCQQELSAEAGFCPKCGTRIQ